MLNGAITIGTDDGANIEIREQVGDENFILFGLSVDEVLNYYQNGGYTAADYAGTHPDIARIITQLHDGSVFGHLPRDEFSGILRALIDYNDEFFVLRDFDDYARAQALSNEIFCDKPRKLAMSVRNIAMAGVFSSDNTIAQYAKEIWKVKANHK
jgi:starch phosphorylase